MRTKKMAFGGLPTQAQATLPAQMQTAPAAPVPAAPAQAGMRPDMPANSNAGGAMRGLDRAAAMSGRTFSNNGGGAGIPAPAMKKGGSIDGVAKKGKTKAQHFAKGGVTRADGIAQKGKTKGKMVGMCSGGMAKGRK